MASKEKKPIAPVVKPFLKGNPTDERTLPGALGFLGVLLMIIVMSFLVCSALTMGNDILRIALNILVEMFAYMITMFG